MATIVGGLHPGTVWRKSRCGTGYTVPLAAAPVRSSGFDKSKNLPSWSFFHFLSTNSSVGHTSAQLQ